MTNKVINFEEDALSKIMAGVDILANSVKVTMGPSGKNVVIENHGRPPTLTKDGVTVAKAVNLKDRFKNIGVQIVKEAASQSAESAGDGTTTSTVLAQSLCKGGVRLMTTGYNFSEIKRGMEDSLNVIVDYLTKISKRVENREEIVNVAKISANGEEDIAVMIADALEKVGPSGVVTVEEAKGFRSSLDIVEGTQVRRGYISPYFINTVKGTCVFEDAAVLLCNDKIKSMNQILPVLEDVHKKNKPLLVICDDIDGEALKGVVMNVSKGILKACIIRSPEFGNSRHAAMSDLAVLFDAEHVTSISDKGIPSGVKLGNVKKVICHSDKTIMISPETQNKKLEDLISNLKKSLNDEFLEGDEKNLIIRRVNRLSSQVAVLRVGGSTELELQERKDRVDDALHATKAAIAEGVLPGGGIALLRCIPELKKLMEDPSTPIGVKAGINNVILSCKVPFQQIVKNTGDSPDVILEKVLVSGDDLLGWDSREKEYVNMFERGILDPHKVVRSSVENAISVACNLISIGCAMSIDDSEPSSHDTPLFTV